MQNCELVSFVTAMACTISKCCSEDEISILAAAFTQLGDTLATMLVNNEINEKRANKKKVDN